MLSQEHVYCRIVSDEELEPSVMYEGHWRNHLESTAAISKHGSEASFQQSGLWAIGRRKSANDRYAGLSPTFGLPDRWYCIALTLIPIKCKGGIVRKISPSALKEPSEHYRVPDTAHRSDAPVERPEPLGLPTPYATRIHMHDEPGCLPCRFLTSTTEWRHDLDTTDLHLCWFFVKSACVA
jgi:hypothetical protein